MAKADNDLLVPADLPLAALPGAAGLVAVPLSLPNRQAALGGGSPMATLQDTGGQAKSVQAVSVSLASTGLPSALHTQGLAFLAALTSGYAVTGRTVSGPSNLVVAALPALMPNDPPESTKAVPGPLSGSPPETTPALAATSAAQPIPAPGSTASAASGPLPAPASPSTDVLAGMVPGPSTPLSTMLLAIPAAPAQVSSAASAARRNAIVLENEKPGALPSEWQLSGPGSTTIEGYSQISVNLGQTVDFRINTVAIHYRIDIYRLGYYGGDGATLVTSIDHAGASGLNQPDPVIDPTTGEVDAGNWSTTDSWAVPSDATSGVYIAKLTREDGTAGVNEVPFIVRNDASTTDILFQTSDQTWQAYNGWGGSNLYGGNGPGLNGAAYAVSYNRPIATRDGVGTYAGPQDFLFGAEYSAIEWMEQNGYDVSYISGVDASTNASLLLNHKAYVTAGHDEYWTGAQRANVTAARDAGVSLDFLSGNEMYWQTQLAPSIAGPSTPNTTLVSYKDTHAFDAINPDGTWTGTFADPTADPALGGGIPSNALTGTLFSVDSDRADSITVPYPYTQLQFWQNTAVAQTPVGGTATLQQNILGYEWDSSPDNGFRPAGLIDLSSTTLPVTTLLLDYGNAVGDGTATHNLTLYRAASGALVFGAGTVYWSWGLNANHDLQPTPTDPSIQQAMVNLFAAQGIQPGTLQSSLTLAAGFNNTARPVSTVTTKAGTSFIEGTTVTITGTAVAAASNGGVVGGVEVSTDGGRTWHPAGGTTSAWTYSWTTPAPGTYQIESRATNDSIYTEIPGPGVSVIVAPAPTVSLFTAADVPTTLNDSDARPIEVGVKFMAATSGKVTAIRFYKGVQNTGVHTGELWSITGQMLATVTFTNESASGWQTATFSTPVEIAAGTLYVASYHTSTGHYSDTPNYFDVARTSGVLSAPRSAFPTGATGVYALADASSFPTTGLESATNFFVDVVFAQPTGANFGPSATADGGFSIPGNIPLTITTAALLANDTDPNGDALTLAAITGTSHGTAVFNPNTQAVLFTPDAQYTGPASFTYAVSDGRGGSSSASVSIEVAAPDTLYGLFGPGSAPITPTIIDGHAVELGVKLQSSQAGTIYGLRFYKGPADSGTHTGELWSAGGTLLASLTFANETASGWQQAFFAQPVTLAATTTYIASYHTNVGFYAADVGAFATPATQGTLTAPAGNGLYSYGPAGTLPTSSSNANYWVDVLYAPPGGMVAPPVAHDDSGFSVTENTALAIPAAALLANDTDAAGLSLVISGVSGAVGGIVSYDAGSAVVTFTPTAGITGPGRFDYTVADAAGGTASASVSLSITGPVSTESLFAADSTPGIITVDDGNAVELGVKFSTDVAGTVTGLRFYKGPQNTGTHTGTIWNSAGGALATATFTNESASGWQTVTFSTPVTVTAGTIYTASYHTNVGHYSATADFFANPTTQGDLTAPATGVSGGNGVYAYGGASTFPSGSYNADNYWVDVQFAPGGGIPPVRPPVATADTGFTTAVDQALSIQATSLLANDTDPNGYTLSVSGVSDGSNGHVSYNATNRTIQFVSDAGYTGLAGFDYAISDGHGGTATAAVSLNVDAAHEVSTLFAPTSTPGTITVNDTSAVELGVKITATTVGLITGLRFYKGPQDTGTHIGNVWSSTGDLLATATFAGESASGWQQVNFGAPVEVTAGTTYVASFHTDAGYYSADANFFATTLTSGPLTAPASTSSGGNGVFAYGGASAFPTSTYNATNYWVDPVFQQLG